MKLIDSSETKVVMIGAGIMSATLAVLLNRINRNIKITIYERLDSISAESSKALNNAGTGHSGFCELNYTPEDEEGNIDISKAVEVASSFEKSKEFWAYLLETDFLKTPGKFIRSVPHMSLVFGEKDIHFLKKRWQKMRQHPLFESMMFSDDSRQLKSWIPLVMKGRDKEDRLAATRMALGTDVNYGALAHKLILNLVMEEEVDLEVAHEIEDVKKKNGKWWVKGKNLTTGEKVRDWADFVFIGAGGGALRLLDKSGIPEARGYAGFPVSGEWLICENPRVTALHHAKVYGKAKIGAPPMSVPHLDSRLIDGKERLLFGPFAGFSTKFLKHGSYWDLFRSLEWTNIKPLLFAGYRNLPLTKYLVEQVIQKKGDKMAALRAFFPDARGEDWEEKVAGQRVQVIKKDEKEGGVLEFGTEIVSAKEGSLAALLGASPGASTAVRIMLDLIERCFPESLSDWQPQLKKMIPSYGQKEVDRIALRESRARTSALLELSDVLDESSLKE